MYKVAVSTDNKNTWACNSLVFEGVGEASKYASDLMSRWLAVTDYYIVDTSKQDVIDYKIVDL